MTTDTVPRPDARGVEDALEALTEARRVVLTTHVQADGDGLGSESALFSLVQELGGEARVINPTPVPDALGWLLPDPSAVLEPSSAAARAWCESADLCVVVDTGELSRIGRVATLVAGVAMAVIDHHPPGDDPIDGVSFRDSRASAAGELVFQVIERAGGPWHASVVDALYVAIMTDTGGFRFSNVTPGTLRVAAELVERGASPDELYRAVYGRFPLRRIRLLEAVLPSVQTSEDGAVAWISVPRDTLRELGCTSEDLEGLVDYPRELEGVEVALLFRELDDGQVKVSFRSNGAVDVNRVAHAFGGGGHLRASGALVPGSLEGVRRRVVDATVAAARTLDPAARPVAGEPELRD